MIKCSGRKSVYTPLLIDVINNLTSFHKFKHYEQFYDIIGHVAKYGDTGVVAYFIDYVKKIIR
jgi:hypothetical protein